MRQKHQKMSSEVIFFQLGARFGFGYALLLSAKNINPSLISEVTNLQNRLDNLRSDFLSGKMTDPESIRAILTPLYNDISDLYDRA